MSVKKSMRSALVLAFLLFVGSISAQTIKVNVKDSQGEPIIGASVVEKDTKNGGVTDFDGNFTIKLTANKPVVVSYIGMKTKTIDAKGKSELSVVLEDDNTQLEEVVAIGYGTVRKKDLTGAVSQVNSKQIENIPVSNVSEALTGKMAGVNITTTEGSPDADVKIRVRGGGSLSQDNSPLYIVDGFEVSSISDIAPSEIETIDVLKDASSTAIYGARGANGVVIVTTKSGKEGDVQVNLNASIGWKSITKELEVLNPYEYARYQYELNSNGNSPMKLNGMANNYGVWRDLEIWKSVEGADFQDETFGRTGVQRQYNASVSGGSKDFKYSVSYAHNDENSIMERSGYRKDNINAKINTKLSKWLTFDFQARLANQRIDGLNGGTDTNESNASNSIVYNSLIYQPIQELTAMDEDEESSSATRRSPSERLRNTYKMQKRFRQDYNASLTWKPFKGWTMKTQFSYNWRFNNTDQVWATRAVSNSSYGYNGAPQAYFLEQQYKGFTNSNTVTYDNKKLFGGRDAINVMVGQEWKSTKQTDRSQVLVSYPTSFTTDQVLANVAAGTPYQNSSFIHEDDNMLSFFGRINYTMMDKYLLTFTLREDGSSKFGKGNRWGLFPSLALAWRMSDEKFLSGVNWLDNLKLRLSIGTAGNNRIPSGSLFTTYKMADATGKHPGFNEKSAEMFEHATLLYNPDLKWETTTTRNIGIDYGFFRGRLNGSIDFYWNTTKDLLMKATVPSSTGYTQQYQNFGKTSNRGIEFTLNYAAIDKKNFKLNANFNISYNKNKIDELPGGATYQTSSWGGSRVNKHTGDFYLEEGGRLGEVWGYQSAGFYTVARYDAQGNYLGGDLVLNNRNQWELAPEAARNNSSSLFGGLYPGTAKVECDANGNPIYQRLGNTIPTTTGGFGIDGQWKTKYGVFDYTVFFNYSLGNKIVNATKLGASFFAGSQKNYNVMNDYNLDNRYTWVDPNTGLNLGRPSAETVAEYGGAQGLMDRLNAMNTNASVWNPAANSTMVVVSDALENANFLRLQNVTIGYSLPKAWIKKFYANNVRIYFTGYNLLCFTKYKGYDPEVDTSSKNNPMTPGVDYAAYPKSRSYVMGINLTF